MARREHVGFRLLVDHLGVDGAARRLGASRRTIRDWLARGVPEARVEKVSGAVRRSEAASRASARRWQYRRLGWRRLPSFEAVDDIISMPAGHARERWEHRKEWWDENRPDETLAKRVDLIVDKEGRLLYVNGDQILWRGYTVTGRNGETRLFWTQATYLDGYDTAEDMKERYESLAKAVVRIHFGT